MLAYRLQQLDTDGFVLAIHLVDIHLQGINNDFMFYKTLYQSELIPWTTGEIIS